MRVGEIEARFGRRRFEAYAVGDAMCWLPGLTSIDGSMIDDSRLERC